ncbi:DUF1285 domain-containing protein [Sphingorhabdus sp. 109]|jgi:hypothetical protein|uniref:DUF1285 domain-containing protein n=1 Tax=Sphingorhabdus sp. 109 TaxID=2653173 RepID=UPI0012F209BE|nr:DUF1285 domain-containing protein [Sphingorhabdus sp. 109]VWX59891.1 Proteophosphoglycan [Sphingorhabdus sp. 109]
MPYTPPPELASLSIAEIAELAEAQKLPPVEQWEPKESGDSEMRIAADGSWYHQGDPIQRPAMVRAFSSILRREADGSFALVTPYQKLSIKVEDAPFVAVQLESQSSGEDRTLAFRLNTDHLVVAGPDHPLRFGADKPQPYLHVRGGLEAVLARPVYYELVELALAENKDPLGIWSAGAFFPMATDS